MGCWISLLLSSLLIIIYLGGLCNFSSFTLHKQRAMPVLLLVWTGKPVLMKIKTGSNLLPGLRNVNSLLLLLLSFVSLIAY